MTNKIAENGPACAVSSELLPQNIAEGQQKAVSNLQEVKSPHHSLAHAFTEKTRKTSTPIFVHSSFRTSSTWFWKKLRDKPNVIAYNEIFHEVLEKLNPSSAHSLNYSAWPSNHPESAPYYLEYLPLLGPSGGVDKYDQRMSVDFFVPADGLDGHLTVDEVTYMELLIQNAHNNDCVPVLTCTRSLGRAGAISRAFSGYNILIYRNIFHQWASYSFQALNGNSFFFDALNKTIKASRHDPFLRMVDDWFVSRTNSPYDEKTFIVFLLFHLYLYGHAHRSSDMIIDITALATDKNNREFVEAELSKLIGSEINLSDAKSEFGVSDFKVLNVNSFLDTIDQFTKFILESCPTEECADFVEKLKSETISEWEKFEFFTHNLSSIRSRRAESELALAEIKSRDGAATQLDPQATGVGSSHNGQVRQRASIVDGGWIDASTPRFSDVAGHGWSAQETWGVWGVGEEHTLEFLLPHGTSQCVVLFEAECSALIVGTQTEQAIDVVYQDKVVERWLFSETENLGLRTVRIELGVVDVEQSSTLTLMFRPDKVVRANDLTSETNDDRELGLAITRIRLTKA